MSRAFFPVLLCLSACVSKGYVSRTLFTTDDPRSVRAMGCLDVSLAVRGPADAPVLHAKAGNGCMEPAAIDLGRMVVIARDASGATKSLSIDDPRAEVVALHLDARRELHEAFRLIGAGTPIEHLCVDLRGVAWSPHDTPPICFDRGGALVWQVSP